MKRELPLESNSLTTDVDVHTFKWAIARGLTIKAEAVVPPSFVAVPAQFNSLHRDRESKMNQVVDVSSLEACERDFRKASRLLASMLEPPSGKVKFRVFGYVRFGFSPHKDMTDGYSPLSEGILGWTSIIKEKEHLELTFIDLKSEEMTPNFHSEISEESTLEIVSPLEVAFHFKKTSVRVDLSMDAEMDHVVRIVFKHNKKCFHKSARFSRTPSPRLVSRPLLIRPIPVDTEEVDSPSLRDKARPSTPIIPRSWRSKVSLNRPLSRSFEQISTPSGLSVL